MLKDRKWIFQLPCVALACVNTDADTQVRAHTCTETVCLVNFKSPSCHVYHYATDIREKISPLQVWGGGHKLQQCQRQGLSRRGALDNCC